MARQENGLQQLVRRLRPSGACAALLHAGLAACSPARSVGPAQVLMALSDNPVVVEETCHTLTLLAEHSPSLADAVVANDATAIMRLLPAADRQRQLSTLRLLAAIASSSSPAAAKLATDSLLASLEELAVGKDEAGLDHVPESGGQRESGGGNVAGGSTPDAVRTAALKALGNLAFCPDNQRKLESNTGLMRRLAQLAQSRRAPVRVQAAALRALAILGENELVRQAVGKPPIQGRGLRILSLGAAASPRCTLVPGIVLPPLLGPPQRPPGAPPRRRRRHEGHGHGAAAARAGASHRQAHPGHV